MPMRTGSARWKGNLTEGNGVVSTETGVVSEAQYNFTSRFEEGIGTNPEELLGAAHAACFSMALSAELAKAGHTPESVKTKDVVHIVQANDGFGISKIEIHTAGSVPGIDAGTFHEFAEDAKKTCPVSKALTGVEFELHAELS